MSVNHRVGVIGAVGSRQRGQTVKVFVIPVSDSPYRRFLSTAAIKENSRLSPCCPSQCTIVFCRQHHQVKLCLGSIVPVSTIVVPYGPQPSKKNLKSQTLCLSPTVPIVPLVPSLCSQHPRLTTTRLLPPRVLRPSIHASRPPSPPATRVAHCYYCPLPRPARAFSSRQTATSHRRGKLTTPTTSLLPSHLLPPRSTALHTIVALASQRNVFQSGIFVHRLALQRLSPRPRSASLILVDCVFNF